MKFQPKKLSKSTGLIIIVAILFVGAVYLNIRTNDQKSGVSANTGILNTPVPTESSALFDDEALSASTVTGDDYFTAFKDSREGMREREIAYLDTIINDPSTDKETLNEAQTQKLSIVECMETEFTIENLVLAKGFKNAAVTFHKGSVNVIVDAESLNSEQVAQILNIVIAETGEPASSIKISARQ